MLDGIGGDDLFAGEFSHLTDLFLQRKIWKLLVQLQCASSLFSYSPYSMFFNYCLRPLIPRTVKSTLKEFLKPFHRNGSTSWINIAYVEKLGIKERLNVISNISKFPTKAQQEIYGILRLGWSANVAHIIEESYINCFGIESRRPF